MGTGNNDAAAWGDGLIHLNGIDGTSGDYLAPPLPAAVPPIGKRSASVICLRRRWRRECWSFCAYVTTSVAKLRW